MPLAREVITRNSIEMRTNGLWREPCIEQVMLRQLAGIRYQLGFTERRDNDGPLPRVTPVYGTGTAGLPLVRFMHRTESSET
jgi:hypothetical protein